jgi:hypothetical protein
MSTKAWQQGTENKKQEEVLVVATAPLESNGSAKYCVRVFDMSANRPVILHSYRDNLALIVGHRLSAPPLSALRDGWSVPANQSLQIF